jgi:CheY-like chemotaxis protein
MRGHAQASAGISWRARTFQHLDRDRQVEAFCYTWMMAKSSTHVKRPLVLVVEDAEDNRALYVEYLRLEGFRVEEAADGHTAIERAIAIGPDAILMDMSLPLVDGWEATRRLKATRETAKIPIIAITGRTDRASRDRAREAGCDLYITKPCAPSDMLDHLRDVLGIKKKKPQSVR